MIMITWSIRARHVKSEVGHTRVQHVLEAVYLRRFGHLLYRPS